VPRIENQVVPENLMVKVSTLMEFLRNCVELMKDGTVLSTLYDMIDHCTKGRETPITNNGKSGTAQEENQRRILIQCADWRA
jgi:hypothetical protein